MPLLPSVRVRLVYGVLTINGHTCLTGSQFDVTIAPSHPPDLSGVGVRGIEPPPATGLI